ncbi:MAG: hypothetical protein ACE5JS_23215, partial [Nitrospinota bacterium]
FRDFPAGGSNCELTDPGTTLFSPVRQSRNINQPKFGQIIDGPVPTLIAGCVIFFGLHVEIIDQGDGSDVGFLE